MSFKFSKLPVDYALYYKSSANAHDDYQCKGNSRFKSSYLIIYGSGGHPLGNLFPEYLEKKGFVEAHADDGLLEVFGLKQGWHASFVMVELISAKHIAQVRDGSMPSGLVAGCTLDSRLLKGCADRSLLSKFFIKQTIFDQNDEDVSGWISFKSGHYE
ncbi:hypothetical protein LWI28_013999 [Acer negundo]|uniref:Diacylglycerol kinase accessory domain-containing protein n=1 Tax=Acer negundo TaxID=4023 RepID=A0AAD5NXZ3_ACENE|nr:hypothetical protein LWI28_013999 [Acer negundo]